MLHCEGVRGLPHWAPANLLNLAGEVSRVAEIRFIIREIKTGRGFYEDPVLEVLLDLLVLVRIERGV